MDPIENVDGHDVFEDEIVTAAGQEPPAREDGES
jgi:hypothetical protein